MSKQVKTFIFSFIILISLMVLTYILTFIIPSGTYDRVLDPLSNNMTIVDGTYHSITRDFPFYKFLLSPILVFTIEGGTTIILIIVFLLIISGVINVLTEAKILSYLIDRLVDKFKAHRYLLCYILILLFMLLGSFVGTFEEIVPFVAIIIALARKLNFNKYIGITISLVAVGSGFACGVMNAFTVGVAQNLAGLALFSGLWLRIVAFIIIYITLCAFTYFKSKSIIKDEDIVNNEEEDDFKKDPSFDKAIISFTSIMILGLALVVCSSFIDALRDYTLIIIAVTFLLAGIVSSIFIHIKIKQFFHSFLMGMVSMIPAIFMIMFASSIKYILVESYTMDTILFYFVDFAKNISPILVVLFIYLIVLIFNFFIPSGSAKAFLLIPLLIPLASICGVSAQLVVLAFAFGDGFSNVFYPTNPVLLISINIGKIGYTKYVKHIWLYQLIVLFITSGLLLLGFAVGY